MESKASRTTNEPLRLQKDGENERGIDFTPRSGGGGIRPCTTTQETTPPPGTTGLDTLGGGMREMVELVNKLRAAGIEGLGLGLPRIAVVGNQSAGKSSLIEAISGVRIT